MQRFDVEGIVCVDYYTRTDGAARERSGGCPAGGGQPPRPSRSPGSAPARPCLPSRATPAPRPAHRNARKAAPLLAPGQLLPLPGLDLALLPVDHSGSFSSPSSSARSMSRASASAVMVTPRRSTRRASSAARISAALRSVMSCVITRSVRRP